MTTKYHYIASACFLISSICFGILSAHTLKRVIVERTSVVKTTRSEVVANHFDDLEQIKMPFLLHEMGFFVDSCDVEAHVTPETAVELEDDSWSVTYTGTVMCHGPEITLFIPSKIGFFVDSDRNLKSSWTILELFAKE